MKRLTFILSLALLSLFADKAFSQSKETNRAHIESKPKPSIDSTSIKLNLLLKYLGDQKGEVISSNNYTKYEKELSRANDIKAVPPPISFQASKSDD